MQILNPALDYYTKLVPLIYIRGWFNVIGLIERFVFLVVGMFRPVPQGPFSKAVMKAVLMKTVTLDCEDFMLAITAQGYTTCPMEGFDKVRVKRILGLRRVSSVVMVISVERGNPHGV